MTKAKAVKKPISDPVTALQYKYAPGKSHARMTAEAVIDPSVSAMMTVRNFSNGNVGELSATDTFEALKDQCAAVEAGDLSSQRAMLAAQAVSLNAIFTEMARRSAVNMGEYPQAMERYMRLALKAQSQSRATVEALDRLANGHEQTVRHVHVDNRGGQAIIADNVQTGGAEIAKSDRQSHATGTIGASAALPCPDPFGNGVPIASGAR